MKYIVGLPFDFDDFTIEKLDSLSDEEKFLIADTNDGAQMFKTTKDFLQAINDEYVDNETLIWYEIEINEEPNELFEICDKAGEKAKERIINLMQKHNVSSLNTAIYMHEYGFDYIDISVYVRKMDAMFFEPVSFITLENDNLRIFYNGETDGECYDMRNTDWMNVYSLVFDIFKAIDNKDVELFTEAEE